MYKTDPGCKQEETNVPAPEDTGANLATDDASASEAEVGSDAGEGEE